MSSPVLFQGGEVSLPNGRNDEVLVHYDILRSYRRSIRSIHRDPRCDLLKVAERVSIVTLLVAPRLLQQQLLKAHGASSPGSLASRYRHIYDCYAKPSFLRTWYGSWFGYLNTYNDKIISNTVLVRDSEGRESVLDASKWLEAFEKIAGSEPAA
jgi:hypothetical protein